MNFNSLAFVLEWLVFKDVVFESDDDVLSLFVLSLLFYIKYGMGVLQLELSCLFLLMLKLFVALS